MKNIVLASTSALYGEAYLAYLHPIMAELFAGVPEIVFVPYARPGGVSHDEYTEKAEQAFAHIGTAVRGLHTFDNPADAIRDAKGFFTGGGNTFLLVKRLQELGLMHTLATAVNSGTPYLGASAGSNIAGINMRTTNDMPIVYPASFDTMGLVPFNINPHYIDPVPTLRHNGETRETRIKEFHTQNDTPVIGLREGNWISVRDTTITVEGRLATRIFEQGKEPYEANPGTVLDF
ncbi:MAG: dipeptidase PepE [Edaphocola sp.]